MPAGIATDHPPHTGHLGKQRLGTPETAAAKDCHINSSGIIRNPAQCKRIDTVAQPFRCRAVGEHMAEVRLADIAQGLDPLPAMRPITGIGNYSFVKRAVWTTASRCRNQISCARRRALHHNLHRHKDRARNGCTSPN